MVAKNDYGLLRRVWAAITARTRFVARLAKSRKGLIVVVGVLSAFTVIALYWARDTDQYRGNLLLNIGANFVGAVFTYVLINPLLARVESREEKVLGYFDHATVVQHINDSKNAVKIFDTGIELLKDQYRKAFLNACRAALRGGVQVEILLLDPDCRAAAQRAEELGSTLDIRLLISENLRCLRKFHSELNQSAQPRFEVRVYATSPLASYYRWDRRALVSFFPTDRSSVDTTQYETSVDSNFAQFIEQRFHESWQASNTCTLELYFAVPIKIIQDKETEWLFASWVVLESRMYLAHPDLTTHALVNGAARLQVQMGHVVALCAGVCSLEVCDAESPVHLAFDRKYGSGQRYVFCSTVDPPLVSD